MRRKQRFLHSKMKFTMTAPEIFSILLKGQLNNRNVVHTNNSQIINNISMKISMQIWLRRKSRIDGSEGTQKPHTCLASWMDNASPPTCNMVVSVVKVLFIV